MKSFFKKIIVFILTLEARLVLKKYKPHIVGITGSVGKTSTKDALFRVLNTEHYTRKSEKSYNSEIGIPLTILGIENAWSNPFHWLKNILEGLLLLLLPNHYPEWLILEIGADAPGDIKRTMEWLPLDVAIITRIGDLPVHVEFFSSIEELVEEKQSIVRGLKKDGLLILNYDDPRVRETQAQSNHYTITYGIEEGADIRGTYFRIEYEHSAPTGTTFNAEYEGNVVPIQLNGVLGHQHMYPALAAIAFGVKKGINSVNAGRALSTASDWAPGRMRILNGIRGSVLIDDSYNSSPVALQEALAVLHTIETTGKKVAILGDMMELGTHSITAHLKAGRELVDVVDILITVGPRAKGFAEGALNAGMPEESIHIFENSYDASEAVSEYAGEGDVILIKGSQSPRLERITKALLAHPEQARELLVRQEKEWGDR